MEQTYAFFVVASRYPAAALVLFVVLRSSSVVVPPIPGFPMDVMAIDLFGPLGGFFVAEAGIMLGSALAFAIARVGREGVGRLNGDATDVRVHGGVANLLASG